MIVLKKLTASFTLLNFGVHEYWRSSQDYELLHKIHPVISISQSKSLWIFPKKERRQITDVSYKKKTEILMNQKPAKSPRSFEDNLLVLLGMQTQWQRPVCFISKDNTNGFKNCHTKVENCSLIYLFL